MKLILLFLLMCFLGGVGGALGSMLGNNMGRGGVFIGGFVGGVCLVVAGGYLSKRWQWISRNQRFWTIVGGILGFGLASLVALTTLSSPLGPLLSTLMIGTGAVLGARIGVSAHENS